EALEEEDGLVMFGDPAVLGLLGQGRIDDLFGEIAGDDDGSVVIGDDHVSGQDGGVAAGHGHVRFPGHMSPTEHGGVLGGGEHGQDAGDLGGVADSPVGDHAGGALRLRPQGEGVAASPRGAMTTTSPGLMESKARFCALWPPPWDLKRSSRLGTKRRVFAVPTIFEPGSRGATPSMTTLLSPRARS